MKRKFPYRLLPLLIVAAGTLGLGLRMMLYSLADNGLLPRAHPSQIAAVGLSILTACLVACLLRPLKFSKKYTHNFPASRTAALGAGIAGLCLLPAAFGILQGANSILSLVWAALAFLSAPCLIITGLYRRKGRRPHFLLHGTLCLFFALHMVCQYRIWSGNPQVADYLFPLLACVFLSLTAYYHTAFDARMDNPGTLVFCGLMAGFFCIGSLANPGSRWFFLAGGLWALTSLCSIQPSQKPEENTDVSA